MLELKKVDTYYGAYHVLHEVSLKIPEGMIVAMLGRNGMGKTTIVRTITGLTPPRRGEIRFKNEVINGLESYQIARKGLALVPQGREIFPSLSVKENLMIGAKNSDRSEAWDLERIYSLFPILKERTKFYGNLLSGGEQQMLSIARALMTNPDMLIMDEPSEGLAPKVVLQISEVIDQLRGSLPLLLVEQNMNMALGVADYVYIISKGTVVFESKPQELKENQEMKSKFLGV
jgi:branched-chain amino acid transport system ATP-binding protein